jgi:hypothetical protein
MSWQEGVELVRAIAWPAVVIFTVWRVGLPFVALLQGRRVDFKGFGFTASVRALEQQQTNAPVGNPATSPAIAANLPPIVNRPALQILENRISELLAPIQQQDREPVLIRGVAAARLQGTHEFVYNRIFGSQIAWLEKTG